jgi:DNA-binding response OmpR family regulator
MKVLLVEDDRKIAVAVKRGLEAEGFTVDVAFDGREGLWRAAEYHYDVMVLDLMLPGADGYRVCRELRDRGDWTPILVLTARDGVADQTKALDTGADDYLTKPFSFPVLVAHVRALLRRTSGSVPVPVEVGDLRLDSARHRCWRGDVELSLTAREFAVLEYLMRRAGLVSPKFEILDGVWEYDFDGDPNIVEVYVRRLRRKIDEPFGRRDLETVRGAGYRLRTPVNEASEA